jgi:two-component system nitrogen regulation sensor histidine kinase NtrY
MRSEPTHPEADAATEQPTRVAPEEDGWPRLLPNLRHEWRVLALGLLPALPTLVVVALLLERSTLAPAVRWATVAVLAACWILGALAIRTTVARPLQTLANIIAALREGDYTMRVRGARPDDALGLALLETNQLRDQLRGHRLGEMEATALLRTVMTEIDVAVFAFDEEDRLRLINRAGERLLGQAGERLVGREAAALQLAAALTGDVPRVEDFVWPGASGRWGVRRTHVRQDGRSHTLLVLTDLSRTLREEQLVAWQRIVRVLSHEINNSMAPIQSIAHTLRALVARTPVPPDLGRDVTHGLTVIANRSEALGRFMSSYARLAHLPAPRIGPVNVDEWVRRTAVLETRVPVAVAGGPALVIPGDADLLDQLLINLVRNGADAAIESNGTTEGKGEKGVCIGWTASDGHLDVMVLDSGPGLVATANLFVPFFTTKPNGSGIGLVLSRQIAEVHGGTLALANRDDARGCVATLRLPTAA